MTNQTVTPSDISLPKGVKDFLPKNAARIIYLRQTLLDIFTRWGFRPVIPPAMEYLNVLERGIGSGLRDKTVRFDDRQSGQLVAFTPDLTPQIARIVATRMREMPLPLRISYYGRVLRHEEQQQGKDREIFQAGVELYGLDGAEADAEMIAMAIESLQVLGVEDFTVDIGQVDFSRGIMEQIDLPEDELQPIVEAIEHKDLSTLRRLLDGSRLDEKLKKEILALPRLFGGREVLDRAAAVVGNDRSAAALENLRKVLAILEVYGLAEFVTFDLGETRGLDYHTGITFQGYLPGFGQAVCAGGRYDRLTAAYGYPVPATGFTFSLLNLLFALDQKLDAAATRFTDLLISQSGQDKVLAQKIARAVRSQGLSAARDMIERSYDETVEYARKMNFRYVLNVEADASSVTLHHLADESKKSVAVDAILAGKLEL
ncbi:MAG: ATP phosphoribosyltransferase regulatory subunit [Desulfuromonas sp.]|nr:MAG: ATP phosphoribosyltransferase regulatory subunit [Desulfuromonas sp.]